MHALIDFKGPIEGYVVNYLKKNEWRAAATQTHDDLLQEAFLVYAKVEEAYPDLDTPEHFMALFKTSWERRFLDLCRKDTRLRRQVPFPRIRYEEEEEADAEPLGSTDNDGALLVAIRQAPAEVLSVVNLMLNAPQELLELALGSWSGTADARRKDGGSGAVNRLLGFPAGYDSLGAVREYFDA